jgi:hypothetical protein
MQMRTILTILILTATSAIAEPVFDAVDYYGDWSVFTDGEACWIGTFSEIPMRGNNPTSLYVTFENDYDQGELSVYDPMQFHQSTMIALIVNEVIYQLDHNQELPEHAFSYDFGLISVLGENETANIVFPNKRGSFVKYRFSLIGFREAVSHARALCQDPT